MALLSRTPDLTSTEPEPEPWTVRYTAALDTGAPLQWERTWTWNSHDRYKAAGLALMTEKTGVYGLLVDGVYYPPHRIRQITWEVVG